MDCEGVFPAPPFGIGDVILFEYAGSPGAGEHWWTANHPTCGAGNTAIPLYLVLTYDGSNMFFRVIWPSDTADPYSPNWWERGLIGPYSCLSHGPYSLDVLFAVNELNCCNGGQYTLVIEES